MRKLFAQILVAVFFLLLAGFMVYQLYIMPLTEIEGLDKLYEYVVAFSLLTIFYAIMWFALYWLFRLLNWAFDNAT